MSDLPIPDYHPVLKCLSCGQSMPDAEWRYTDDNHNIYLATTHTCPPRIFPDVRLPTVSRVRFADSTAPQPTWWQRLWKWLRR